MTLNKIVIKGVIFDLDGTLINSLQDIADSMNAVLSAKGLKTYDYDSYRYFVGRGLRNLVSQVLPVEDRSEENITAFYADLMKEYEKNLITKTTLYQGIPAMLDKLKARNFKLAVLSNKDDGFTNKIAGELLSKWSFDVIFGLISGIPRKPDPTGALMVCKTFNVTPEEILYLGDTGIDMRTALAAGMHPVGVTWGFRTRKELTENGAGAIIDSPGELFHLL
jgi:phosphoglycolate phosphatase